MYVRERYRPQVMGANSTYRVYGGQIGGFLAKTSGTINIVANDGTTIVDTVAVTAGVYLPLPFILPTAEGATVTLAGGASGTLAI